MKMIQEAKAKRIQEYQQPIFPFPFSKSIYTSFGPHLFRRSIFFMSYSDEPPSSILAHHLSFDQGALSTNSSEIRDPDDPTAFSTSLPTTYGSSSFGAVPDRSDTPDFGDSYQQHLRELDMKTPSESLGSSSPMWNWDSSEDILSPSPSDSDPILREHSSSTSSYGDAPPKSGDGLSSTQAYFVLTSAMIGSGLLAIPYSMREVGVLGGAFGLIVVALMSNFTLKLLISFTSVPKFRNASQHLLQSYASIGSAAFGKPGEWIVGFAVSMSQMGFCCSYLIFIMDNLYLLSPHFSKAEWILYFIAPILFGLMLLRTLDFLAYTSYVSAFCIIGTVVAVLVDGMTDPDKNHSGNNLFDPSSIPLL